MSWIDDANNHPKSTHPFEERVVTLADIQIDLYQRDLQANRVQTIRKKFDPALANAIHVSLREGSLYAVDGHHTKVVLELEGFTEWPARVHHGLTIEEEADFFVDYNVGQKSPTALEKFKASMVARKPDALDVDAVLAAHDIAIQGSHPVLPAPRAYAVAAVQKLFQVYGLGGRHLLAATVDLCVDTWPLAAYGAQETLHQRVLPGIARALATASGPWDRDRLVAVLAEVKPSDWARATGAMEQNRGAANVIAKAVLAKYAEGTDEHPKWRRNSSNVPTITGSYKDADKKPFFTE